jgi:hypothetical protein
MRLREYLSSPPNKNKSLRDPVEADLLIPHPASMKRGVAADRHETWVRDAMDAGAPGAIVARTSGTFSAFAKASAGLHKARRSLWRRRVADGEVVWF